MALSAFCVQKCTAQSLSFNTFNDCSPNGFYTLFSICSLEWDKYKLAGVSYAFSSIVRDLILYPLALGSCSSYQKAR